MTDTYTPEGDGYTARHSCGWECWRKLRPEVEKAIHTHKQKCKAT